MVRLELSTRASAHVPLKGYMEWLSEANVLTSLDPKLGRYLPSSPGVFASNSCAPSQKKGWRECRANVGGRVGSLGCMHGYELACGACSTATQHARCGPHRYLWLSRHTSSARFFQLYDDHDWPRQPKTGHGYHKLGQTRGWTLRNARFVPFEFHCFSLFEFRTEHIQGDDTHKVTLHTPS